jgi:membrane protease YdiL (CAAX protease family)
VVCSAVFVSALWGLWHYPTEGPGNPLATAGLLLLIHIPVGVCLSLGWRKSGNLLVPGIAHAFIDAVRNAIFHPVN